MNIEKLKRMAKSLAKRASKEAGIDMQVELKNFKVSPKLFAELKELGTLKYNYSDSDAQWLKYEDNNIELIFFKE